MVSKKSPPILQVQVGRGLGSEGGKVMLNGLLLICSRGKELSSYCIWLMSDISIVGGFIMAQISLHRGLHWGRILKLSLQGLHEKNTVQDEIWVQSKHLINKWQKPQETLITKAVHSNTQYWNTKFISAQYCNRKQQRFLASQCLTSHKNSVSTS